MNKGLRSSIHQVGLEPKIGTSGLRPKPPAKRPRVITRSGKILANLSQVLKILKPKLLMAWRFSGFKFFKVHL